MEQRDPLLSGPASARGPADDPAFGGRASRARWLKALATARVGNAWLRAAASTIVACVAVSVIGNALPLIWLAVMIPTLFVERVVFRRLFARCEAGDPPERMTWLILWLALQSSVGNSIALVLWFAPYINGQTLAVMYLMGGLANAAATLRSSTPLALAGATPTVAFLLGLPILDFALDGGVTTLKLMPLIGGLLLLGFGINLWRSLQASDIAVAQAEIAAKRERQAAASAAAAKSDTIRRMKDELRTPMAALIGASEHLRRAAVSAEARAHIATLVQASEVLKMVLDDLADLDRLENGQLRIEVKPTDPREIARTVVNAFHVAAQDKNLELFLDIDRNVPALVEIDALRVRQILSNLVANAIRYTTNGGVRVRVQIQPAEDSGHVRLGFAVADTGAGMSRGQLALVLKRERVGGEGEGPGLGLAISLRLARLMGAHLAAKSNLGQGSVFSLVLTAPVCAARADNAA